MSPTPPPESRRTASERSADATRRQVVRTIGAGAALLGAGALAGTSGAQSEPELVRGIDDWELSTEAISPDEVADGPTVEFEDTDTVLVRGSYVFSQTGCYTFEPRRIAYDDGTDRLGVIVDATTTERPDDENAQPCADALQPLRYELRVTAADSIDDTVVEEAFDDGGRSLHPRIGTGELEPPAEVADYEFEVGESVSIETARSTDPTVTFDGDDVVVEGALVYGSSGCDTIALTGLQREHEVEGHVGAIVRAQRRDAWMPGDGCTADVAAARYRLELTGSGEPPIHRCSVRDYGQDSLSSLTVEREDDDLELPEGVTDHRLLIDQTGSSQDAEDDPRPSIHADGDEPAVVVEGTITTGSSSCDTLGVEAVGWSDDAATEDYLQVRLAPTEREHAIDACTDDIVTSDYRLELTLEEAPDAVTAEEVPLRPDEPIRSATVRRDECLTVGGDQEVCDVDGDGHYRDVTGDGDLGQDDVVAFFENQHRDAWKRDAFDFSGNGDVNQFDVVELFDYVLTQ